MTISKDMLDELLKWSCCGLVPVSFEQCLLCVRRQGFWNRGAGLSGTVAPHEDFE